MGRSKFQWQNREALVIKRYKHKCIQTIEMSLCSNKSIHETSKHMMPCTGTIETYTANRNKLYNLTFEWDSIVIIHRNHWWSIWWNIGPCRKVRRLSWRIIDSFLRNKYKSNWWAFGDWRNRYSTDKKSKKKGRGVRGWWRKKRKEKRNEEVVHGWWEKKERIKKKKYI